MDVVVSRASPPIPNPAGNGVHSILLLTVLLLRSASHTTAAKQNRAHKYYEDHSSQYAAEASDPSHVDNKGWIKLPDAASGCDYYYNNDSGETLWEPPGGTEWDPNGAVETKGEAMSSKSTAPECKNTTCAQCQKQTTCYHDSSEAYDADGDGKLDEHEKGGFYCETCWTEVYGSPPEKRNAFDHSAEGKPTGGGGGGGAGGAGVHHDFRHLKGTVPPVSKATTCAQCSAATTCYQDGNEAFDADGDGKMDEHEMGGFYCEKCWTEVYGEPPVKKDRGEAPRKASKMFKPGEKEEVEVDDLDMSFAALKARCCTPPFDNCPGMWRYKGRRRRMPNKGAKEFGEQKMRMPPWKRNARVWDCVYCPSLWEVNALRGCTGPWFLPIFPKVRARVVCVCVERDWR